MVVDFTVDGKVELAIIADERLSTSICIPYSREESQRSELRRLLA